MMSTRRRIFGTFAALFVGLAAAPVAAGGRAQSHIVVLHDNVDVTSEAGRLGKRYGFSPARIFAPTLNGFSAALTPEAVEALRADPAVKDIRVDGLSRPMSR